MMERAMAEEMLELTVGKFTFRVPRGLHYSDANVWVKIKDGQARLGLADWAQQRSGVGKSYGTQHPGNQPSI